MRKPFLIVWLCSAWAVCAGPAAWAAPSGDSRDGSLAVVELSVHDLEPQSGPRLIPALPERILDAAVRTPPSADPQVSPARALASEAIARLEGRTGPLEERLFADAADGRWHEHTLLEAALVASGVESPDDLRRYQQRVADLVAEMKRSIGPLSDPRARAQAIYEQMHARVLRGGYQLDSTDLTMALDRGRFNCVSASVLYNWLASRFGLSTSGVEVPGHAMSRLLLADGPLDVETTCPNWFRLLDDPKKQADAVEKTLGFRPSSGMAARAREVSDVELVATIYYNRGVDLLGQKRFAEALAANAKALRLDPSSQTAQGNLLATLNNWAIELAGRRQFLQAIGLLSQGMNLAPDYETFKVNYVHVHYQWVEESCRQGRFREALDLLSSAAQVMPGESYFPRATLDVRSRWARSLLAAGRMNEAFAVFDEARKVEWAPAPAGEAEAAEIAAQAERWGRENRWAESVGLLRQGLARQPENAVLSERLRSSSLRWAQASLLSGNYAEAIRRMAQGTNADRPDPAVAAAVRQSYSQWIKTLESQGRRNEAKQVARQASSHPLLAGQSATP